MNNPIFEPLFLSPAFSADFVCCGICIFFDPVISLRSLKKGHPSVFFGGGILSVTLTQFIRWPRARLLETFARLYITRKEIQLIDLWFES